MVVLVQVPGFKKSHSLFLIDRAYEPRNYLCHALNMKSQPVTLAYMSTSPRVVRV